MNAYTFKHFAAPCAEDALAALLFETAAELRLPDFASARAVVDLCFEKGGVIAAYHQERLGGLLGYFRGVPADDFANREVAFLYVGAVLEPYRGTRMFARGLLFGLQALQNAGMREIRLQAEASNAFTNGLYSRFARPVGRGHSLRGLPVVTYGGSIADAIAYLSRGRRPGSSATVASVGGPAEIDTGHPLQYALPAP